MNYPHKEKERMRHHRQLRLLNEICDHIPRISSESLTKVRQLRHLVVYTNYLQNFLNVVTKGSYNIKATKNLIKDIKDTKSMCETSKVVKRNSHRKASKAHIVFLHSAKSPKSNGPENLKIRKIPSQYKDAISLTSEYMQSETLPIDHQPGTNSSFELPYTLSSTSVFPVNQMCNKYEENLCSVEFTCGDKLSKENCQPITFESFENKNDIKFQGETQTNNFQKLTNAINSDYILKDITFSKMNDDFNYINTNAFIRNEDYFSNQFEAVPMQHNSHLFTSYCNSLNKCAHQCYDLAPSMCYANGIPVAPIYINHSISSPGNDSDSKSYSSTSTEKKKLDIETLSNSDVSFINNNVDFPTSKCDTYNIHSSMYSRPQSNYESIYPTSYPDFGNTMASPSIYPISDKNIFSMTNIRDVDDTVFPLLNDGYQAKILYGDSECDKIMLNNPSHTFYNDEIESYYPAEETFCSLAEYISSI